MADRRQVLRFGAVARGVVIGFGVLGYTLAMQGLHRLTQTEQ